MGRFLPAFSSLRLEEAGEAQLRANMAGNRRATLGLSIMDIDPVGDCMWMDDSIGGKVRSQRAHLTLPGCDRLEKAREV